MMRSLGTLLALTLTLSAAACGEDTGEDARPGDPSSSSGPVGGGTVEFTQVALVHETAAGGRVSRRPEVLDSPAALTAFVRSFDGRSLRGQIRAAARRTDVPEDQVLVGAVVGLGCDVPPGVGVHRTADGLDVAGLRVKDPIPECFAPVTTVALLLVDADAVAG